MRALTLLKMAKSTEIDAILGDSLMQHEFLVLKASKAVVLCLLVAACAAPAPSPISGTGTQGPFGSVCRGAPSDSAAVADLKAKILAYTNASRRDLVPGAPSLRCEGGLVAIADSHSDWMARARKMSHTDGRSAGVFDRVVQRFPAYQGLVAENLGVITTTFSGPGARTRTANYAFDPDEMARNFVDGWLDSPGHRKNLLHPRMTHLGVGVAIRGTSIYVTQIFADPAE